MKKSILFLVLFVLATGAFAVDISLDAHLSTIVFNPALESALAIPSIGVGIGIGPVDILTNFELSIERDKTNSGSGDQVHRQSIFGILPGVAFNAAMAEKLTLSFPFFMKIYILGERFGYSSTPPDEVLKKNVRVGFGIDAGARAYYALTQNWSIYAGFQADILSIYGKGKSTNYGGKKTDGSTSSMYWFNSGSIDLGIKYTIGNKSKAEKVEDEENIEDEE